jgi:hypothetical protein
MAEGTQKWLLQLTYFLAYGKFSPGITYVHGTGIAGIILWVLFGILFHILIVSSSFLQIFFKPEANRVLS